MATGVSLSEMLDMLRAECGMSTNVAHGVGARDALVHRLRRVQEELANEYDWPILKVRRTVDLLPGEARYEFPADMDFEFVNAAFVQWGANDWTPIVFGINPPDFSSLGEDYQSWPPQRWDFEADETRMFRLWPVPNQSGRLMFSGRKKLGKLVDSADRSTLDATMITLFAAAEIRAEMKAEDAGLKLQKAQGFMRKLKARQSSNKTAPLVMGSGDHVGGAARAGIDYIPMGYGNGG